METRLFHRTIRAVERYLLEALSKEQAWRGLEHGLDPVDAAACRDRTILVVGSSSTASTGAGERVR